MRAVEPAVREHFRHIEHTEGQSALYRMLQECDPDAAARIQPNDRYRTMRALEVLKSTGKSLFSFAWPRETRKDMRMLLIGLDRPREELYARIDQRVCTMFREGLVDEVKGLLGRGYGAADPGLRGIGYREILEMRWGCETFPLVRDRIAQATRRYAKRQLTFFRSVPGVAWAHPDDREAIAARINSFVPAST